MRNSVHQHHLPHASTSNAGCTTKSTLEANSARIQQAKQLASQLDAAFFHRIGKITIENGTFVQHNHITIISKAPSSITTPKDTNSGTTVDRNEANVPGSLADSTQTSSTGPPRPDESNGTMTATGNKGDMPPPHLPPKPAQLQKQNEIYSRPIRYEVEELPPQPIAPVRSVQMPMPPGPHLIDHTPSQALVELSISQQPPQPQIPQALPQPIQPAQMSTPLLTAPLPVLAQLEEAAPIVQQLTHDPTLKVAWCRDIFYLIKCSIQDSSKTDLPIGPVTISDPSLARLAHIAVPLVLQLASSHPTPPSQGQKLPRYIAEVIAMRAILAATGAFPEHVTHDPCTAFRDFHFAAKNGFPRAYFNLGRDFENFDDHVHAKRCFEKGVGRNVESCLWRMGIAHLLGQLSLPRNPRQALALLHRAATLASLTCPQPAYVYALLLLSEFTGVAPLHPSVFAPYIPKDSSPHLEARKHLERAAFLHFAPAQYRLGFAYEFAEPPFPFDPLLSVQYYLLASQQGEVGADMALSKWFLCGSCGAARSLGPATDDFDKDESLALFFAEKAANRGLPTAQFAMGYYAEVGIGRPASVDSAIHWYTLASQQGNTDAIDRLNALNGPRSGAKGLLMTREEHEDLTRTKVEKRRSMAMERMESGSISPPWEGRHFPGWKEVRTQQQRRRQHPGEGRMVIENIRKSSLGERERGNTSPSAPISTMSPAQISTSLFEPQRTDPVLTRENPSVQTLAQRQPQRCTDLRDQFCDRGRGQVHHCHLHLPNLFALPVRACPPSAKATKTGGKHKPQTFAEMGFYSAKAEDSHKDKDCVLM